MNALIVAFVNECPADAIKPDAEPDAAEWVEFNRKYSEQWPNITIRRDPLPDADKMEGEPDKFENSSPIKLEKEINF